jgi:hypothetical protein
MRPPLRHLLPAATAWAMLLTGCGGTGGVPPAGPSPSPGLLTANAFILPGAVTLSDWAFGDEPIVIYTGERLRWVNADTLTHLVVADTPDRTDFDKTEELPSGGEQSFIMTTPGMTGIHCAIHPNMTGTLIVRERSRSFGR